MSSWYCKILDHPLATLLACLAVCLALASGLRDFRFDASADTLVVDGDPALAQYNDMASMFSGDEFIVLTYTSDDVLADESLAEIGALQQALADLPGVSGAWSILDMPLIESPPVPLEAIAEDYRTLLSPDVDLALARRELTQSPLVSDFLISADGETTAISATLERDTTLEALRLRWEEARRDGRDAGAAKAAWQERRADYVANRDALIESLRSIRDGYTGEAQLFISGVPMIAADMLAYVRSDINTFGLLVLLLIVILLAFFFRNLRWVVIPLAICLTTVAVTTGILGWLDTPVTVVSSNFMSLLSIISISFSIHLIVRYRELQQQGELEHRAVVLETMRSKFAPCLYTALTTLFAFGSMFGSRILPVVDFGWMMCLGIVLALIITFLLFPTILLLLGPARPHAALARTIPLTEAFRFLSTERTKSVVLASILLAGPAVYGVTLISFDNRFIDYFSESTDIYQGMSQIDRHLGGTLPLDVYIRFDAFEAGEDDFFDGFEEEYPERYWFTPEKIEVLRQVQFALEERSEIGKVISLASMEQLARRFNDGEALTGLEIAYVLGELPADIRNFLIEPYAHPAGGWLRINARITESLSDFSKDELIRDINRFATETVGISGQDVIVTGMVVLFNDMLQQLADSQSRTILYVIAATFVMFLLLLRSLKLAVIALVPNILAATLIISVMGYAGIPMDMMTVTIAAICIGIGVDDAIHYLHRFREELAGGGEVRDAVVRSHQTIGHAMYFTTMTVMGGFSVLVLSNFIPTIYFGLLTALAMALALLANMTLLPALLMLFCKRQP